MKFRTVTERIGEWLGPVDWSYDFDQHSWVGRSGGCNPECIAEGVATLRRMAADPDGWSFSPSGWSSFPVVEVGMYDGWPFWKPTPAIGYIGPLGGVEVAFFYNLHREQVRRVGSRSNADIPRGSSGSEGGKES